MDLQSTVRIFASIAGLVFALAMTACSPGAVSQHQADDPAHSIASQGSTSPATTSLAPTRRPQAPSPGAKVVVAIVVDQLAAWIAQERWPTLPPGGFQRLTAEGTWVKNLVYLHAMTETAPGHASLYTGKVPRDHGIVGNLVYRNDLGRSASQMVDAAAQLIGPDGKVAGDGVSLHALRQPTLADRLLARDPKAVVVSLSLKDRGALFAGGRQPKAAIWYDDKGGTMVTSSALAKAMPSWALPFAYPLAKLGDQQWELLDRDFVASHVQHVDDQVGEDTGLGGRAFPHALPNTRERASLLRFTPFTDAWLIDLALAALDHARDPAHPMLLALSLSANDYVGHYFGPDSWEAWDQLLRLDRQLARFLAALDARLGPQGYAVVLSGDHGIGPLPEVVAQAEPAWCQAGAQNPYEKPCKPSKRLVGDTINRKIQRLNRRAGSAPLLEMVESWVFYTAAGQALPPNRRRALDRAVMRELSALPGVAKVWPADSWPAGCPDAQVEDLAALVCRSGIADLGDFFVALQPGVFFASHQDRGIGHGSHYRYDRVVPLVVRYPGGPAGHQIERAPFGSFAASLWFALTGERSHDTYGETIGAPAP